MPLSLSRAIALTLVTGLCAISAHGQVSYSVVDSTYTQNFDKVGGYSDSGVNSYTMVFGSNTTFAGWYASNVSWNGTAFSYADVTSARVSIGSDSTVQSLFIFRPSASASRYEGALGSIPIDANSGGTISREIGGIYYGVQIVNNTTTTLTSFSFGYTGEQWGWGSSGANALTVSYQIGGTDMTSGAWVGVAGATFNSPLFSNPTSGVSSLNGNDVANQVTLAQTITGVTIAPGESIWIRFFDVNNTGYDQGLAVDNFWFTTSAVPEPSTYAVIAGVGMMLAAGWKRRQKNARR